MTTTHYTLAVTVEVDEDRAQGDEQDLVHEAVLEALAGVRLDGVRVRATGLHGPGDARVRGRHEGPGL